jgi:hypothetical protein
MDTGSVLSEGAEDWGALLLADELDGVLEDGWELLLHPLKTAPNIADAHKSANAFFILISPYHVLKKLGYTWL